MTLDVQFLTLTLMVGCGAMLGAAFDVAGTVARDCRLPRAAAAAIDAAYWLAATVVVFRVLLYANHGQVRLYVFLGLAAGAILYTLLFSSLVRTLSSTAVRVVRWIIKLLISTLTVLLFRPGLFIFRIVARCFRFLGKAAVFMGKTVVQWGRRLWLSIRRKKE